MYQYALKKCLWQAMACLLLSASANVLADTHGSLTPPPPVVTDAQTASPQAVGSEGAAAEDIESGQPSADESEATGVEPADEVELAAEERLSWDTRIDRFEQDQRAFAEGAEDPDELYEELGLLIRLRGRQLELMLADAGSRESPADSHTEVLAAIYPGVPVDLVALPEYVVTVQDAHENLLALYGQRIRLLEYVSKELRAQITGLDLYGMRELYFESAMIWLELRYQVVRIPDAGKLVVKMAKRAPLPLIWFVLELALLIFIFRWWRRWVPETIKRMRSYLLAIRPRSSDIVRRMRWLWYIERIHKPIEWLIFFVVLFGLIDFLQFEFVTDIGLIIIRWVFISWFIVAFLDAVISRGAGGAASEIGKTRRQSFRLLAAWLVLLGLGLELADRLSGQAALYTNVWRLFQILFFPVVFIQLGMWRSELFRRTRLEDKEFMSRTEFESQSGLGKHVGAAKLLGFLFAARLRSRLLQRLERFDPGRTASTGGARSRATAGAAKESLDPELRAKFLSGAVHYSKYARDERSAVVARINEGVGGEVIVVGERGLGKDGFLQKVCGDADPEYLLIDCGEGTALSVEQQLAAGLGIDGPLSDKAAIAAALADKGIDAIAIRDAHMLVRPVMEGFAEMEELFRLAGLLPGHVVRVVSMDRYAWQYICCALPEMAAGAEVVILPAWSDEQIHDLLESRCREVGLEPDFTKVRVPSQYLTSGEDTTRERNRKGISAMIATLSGGNPSIATRLFANCLYKETGGRWIVGSPKNPGSQSVEKASLHMLLVLRVIAQADRITEVDIVANLRYPESVVKNALHLALGRGWVREADGRYSLAWPWFRTITRVLARQNLLAGVRQVIE